MVSMVFGLPGSGKTLLLGHIAERAIHGKRINHKCLHIQKHCHDIHYVFTNFPCSGAYKLDFDSLGKVDYHDCIIIIDEVQLLADSRNFRDFGENIKLFFSCHRQKHIDLILASQSYDTCDKRIRSITDKLYYVDSFYFNFMRVREIESYFRVDKTIQEGYEFSSGFSASYFYKPRLYKNVDSFSSLFLNSNIEPSYIKW